MMEDKKEKKRISFLGFPIDALTMEETLAEAERIIKERRPVQHCVLNAAKLVYMKRDSRLGETVSRCALINADGQSIVWAARLLGSPLPERVTGADLMENLLSLAAEKGYRVYFFGAGEGVVKKVVEVYNSRYPGLKITGYRNGYFKKGEEGTIVRNIRESRPDILFVGMSTPKKEFWLAENLKELNVPFCMGVGGSFDIVAGLTRRAPVWMQRCGLEWFYRFLQEPLRMLKRYPITNTVFIYLVLKEFILRGLKSEK